MTLHRESPAPLYLSVQDASLASSLDLIPDRAGLHRDTATNCVEHTMMSVIFVDCAKKAVAVWKQNALLAMTPKDQ